MANFEMKAEPRKVVGKKVKRLREQGLVPITVYGPNQSPLSFQVPYRELEVTLMRAGGTNLITLKADGNNYIVLAREVQRDVLKGKLLHADFFAVDEKTRIAADIPIHLVGESPVVVARQGILITGTNTVRIETLPGKLINFIEINLSELKEIGDSITVADLDLGGDIIILDDPEEMLVRVAQTSAARAELLSEMQPEEEQVDAGVEPEVIARGKEEEE